MPPRKKAGANCCVVGCRNNTLNSPGTRFYVFSRVYYKKAQTDRWIAAVRRTNPDGSPWEPKKYTRICSRHFIGNKKSDHPFSPSFVPTIFPEIRKNVRAIKNSAKTAVSSSTRFESDPARQTNLPEGSRNQFVRLLTESSSKFAQSLTKQSDLPKNCLRISTEPIMEIQSLIEHEDVPQRQRLSRCHRRTQVDFSETPMDCKIFICNRYIDGVICEAESQACFPRVADPLGDADRRATEEYGKNQRTFQDASVSPDCTNRRENSLSKRSSRFHGLSSITTDREMIDLASVTLDTFHLLLKILEGSRKLQISQEERLLMFLFKMKQDTNFSALSFLFNCDRTMISQEFHRTLKFLSHACKNFVLWPSGEFSRSTTPGTLKKTPRNRRVIVNWAHIRVEKPRNAEQRLRFYSVERKTFTVKFLVACTTNGLISFVSKFYDGQTRDDDIARKSGFLDLLETGDIVIVDKVSPEIKSAVKDGGKEILLAIPRCRRDNQYSIEETREADIVGSVRTLTARTVRRIKNFGILSKLTVNMLPYSDNILLMCCVLANLQSRVIKI